MNRPAPTCATTPTLTRRRLVMALPLLGGVAWSPNAGARGAPQRASRALMGTQVDIVADGGDVATWLQCVRLLLDDLAQVTTALLHLLFQDLQHSMV